MAGSAQRCCHEILGKGEKSDLVCSKVLSWDTEERRDMIEECKVNAHCAVSLGQNRIQGKREKNG